MTAKPRWSGPKVKTSNSGRTPAAQKERPARFRLLSKSLAGLAPDPGARSAGVETSYLYGLHLRVADPGGDMLGVARGNTIWLDDNAGGRGRLIQPTPPDDAEFPTPGDEGQQRRMDLLSAVINALGDLLGQNHDHDDGDSDVTDRILTVGEHDWPTVVDEALCSFVEDV